MRRRQENEAGPDPGKREGWQQRAVSGINKSRYSKQQVQAGMTFWITVRRAASRRGLSLPAYMRRASAAFAAHDLGEDFKEILSDSAHPDWVNRKDPQTGHWIKTFDDGEGYGSWEVK